MKIVDCNLKRNRNNNSSFLSFLSSHPAPAHRSLANATTPRPPRPAPGAAPVPPPTQPPVPPPTQAPVPPPTQAPVPPPTQAPVPSPTNAPVGGNESFCCSNNYKDCDVSGWCAENQSRCEGSCSGRWIEVGHCPSNGIPLYGECTGNVDGCCTPGVCQGNQYYRQCV